MKREVITSVDENGKISLTTRSPKRNEQVMRSIEGGTHPLQNVPKDNNRSGVNLPKINQIDIIVPSQNEPERSILVRNSVTVSPTREREGIIKIREPVRRSNAAALPHPLPHSMTSSD